MNMTIYPSSFDGVITAPSSKSLTHRALICAAFSKKPSLIHNPLICDDTILTIKALMAIGVEFKEYDDALKVIPPKKYNIPKDFIECGNSGTTFRFLLPFFNFLFNGMSVHADERLITRIKETDFNSLPICYRYTTQTINVFNWDLPTEIYLNDTYTSQYISGLLLVGPLLEHDLTLYINKNNHPINPYISMTIDVMSAYGVNVESSENDEYYIFKVSALSEYQALDYDLEGDYSQAANFLVMGALGKYMIVKNLNRDSCQGDKQIIDYLEQMGANLETAPDIITIRNSQLHGGSFDIYDTPDLGPLLMGTLAVVEGSSEITGFSKLTNKESNRLTESIRLITELGGNIHLAKDKILIEGTPLLEGNVTIDCPNDHRLIMMLVAISPCYRKPITIKNAEAVNKSYPNFWHDLRKISTAFFEVTEDEKVND